jgi:hypothetical protein
MNKEKLFIFLTWSRIVAEFSIIIGFFVFVYIILNKTLI